MEQIRRRSAGRRPLLSRHRRAGRITADEVAGDGEVVAGRVGDEDGDNRLAHCRAAGGLVEAVAGDGPVSAAAEEIHATRSRGCRVEVENVAVGDGVAAVELRLGGKGAGRVDTVGRGGRAVADVAGVERVVVVAIRPRGGAEDHRAAGGAGVDSAKRDELERVVARLIDEAQCHARGAGVLDGQLLRRADSACSPVDGDELRPIQIHRLSCCATDAQARCSGLWSHGKRVRGRRAEIAEDERESFHAADVVGLKLYDERAAEACVLDVRDGLGQRSVDSRGADAPRAADRCGR